MGIDSPTTRTAGALLGRRYRLHETLGQGGMGVVYRATDRLSGNQVALKRVTPAPPPELVPAPEESGFLPLALAREFQLLASLRHPHIISVLDYGFDEERAPYFTMELLEGARTVLQAGRNRSRTEQVGLLVQTLEALAYLHRRGILHRDLKPSNVLVVDGHVKLLDFGLASVREQARGKVGTPAYMAPEVLLDKPLGPAADLYAVGVIAYQLITGRHPYDTSSLQRLLADIVASSPDLGHLEAVLSGTALPDLGTDLPAEFRQTAAATLQAAALAHTAVAPPLELTLLAGIEAGDRNANPLPEIQPPRSPLAALVGRLMSRRAPQKPYDDAIEVIRDLCQAVETPAPGETLAIRESFLKAARFVGRDKEMAHLAEALASALAGHGSAWLVGGESGIGKSRLLTELAPLARVQGALVLQGQAVSEAESPFHLWRAPIEHLVLAAQPEATQAAVLKTVAPAIEGILDRAIPDPAARHPEALREALVEATVDLFLRTAEPVVLLLEDLHWAGDESLAVLQRLIRKCGERRLLIVASYRDEERPGLPLLLGDMHTLRLGRLDEKSVLELGVSMLGEAARSVAELLQRESEGNVFFLVEVVRALAEDAERLDEVGSKPLPARVSPEEVRRVVRRRLDRVPSEARPLLEAAAVLGRQLDLGVLRAAFPGTELEPWLNRCASSAVLEVAEGHWRFAHDRLREGVLETLSPLARRQWHQRLAAALGTTGAPVTALAHHLLRGESWDEAASACMRAADEAAELYLHAKARAHSIDALDALGHLDDSVENRRRRIDSVVRLATVAAFSDNPERNLALLAEAEVMVRDLPGEDGVPGSDSLRIARVHHVLGRSYYVHNEIPKAIACWTRGMAAAQAAGDQELLALPSSVIGRAHVAQGRYGDAAPLLTRASATLEKAGNWPEWIAATGCLAVSLAARGHYGEGLAEADRALAKAQETGNLTATAVCHILRCTVRLHGNDATGMQQEARAALAAAERSGDQVYTCLGWGMLAWAQGRLGQQQEAARSLANSKSVGQSLGGRIFISELFAAAEAELALAAGDPEGALQLAEAAVAQAQSLGSAFAEAHAEKSWGLALGALGRREQADIHLARSVDRFRTSCAAVLEAARTQLAWARLRQDQGDAEGAAMVLGEAPTVLAAAGCIS